MSGRRKKTTKVVITPRQEYIIKEKTRICMESGWEPTPENFEKIDLWDTYGRIDNYLKGKDDTWGKWWKVNNYILHNCKPGRKSLTASEINEIMKEAGIY